MTLHARSSDPADTPLLLYAPERPQDRHAADALIERAFGPGRYAKTAERLREGNRARADLSFCAHAGETLIGTVRLWPVRIGEQAAVFLGPIAVEHAWRSHGVGAALVERACEAARATGESGVLLVGDLSFFGPLGFAPVQPGAIRLPGPANARRVLWRALQSPPSALEPAASGAIARVALPSQARPS